MKEFDVTIIATVRKTYRVEGETADEATDTAHQLFSVLNDDVDESYEQDTVDCEEVE
jgi:hypothetical protein